MSLTRREQEILLSLAREAITQAAHRRELPSVELEKLPAALQQHGASFVTLTKHGELRGCIGSLEAVRPLALDVRENALAAAFRDPRFSPLGPDELNDVRVEISVLSPPVRLEYKGAEDLIAKLRPGMDGVVIERGWNRATFLPQVWEKLPDPHQFLEHLCMKAYLPINAYRQPGLDVYTYQVEKFMEEGKNR